MTNPQANSSHAIRRRGMTYRRSVLLFGLLTLVVVGAFWWWTRPRIDPRLVGTWAYHVGSKMSRDELRLHGNGHWTRTLVQGDGITMMAMSGAETWDVRNGVLTLHSREFLFPRGGSFFGRWQYTSQQLWNRLAGNPPVHGVRRYQIQDSEDGRVVLQEMELSPTESPLSDFPENPLSSYVGAHDYGRLEQRFRWGDVQ